MNEAKGYLTTHVLDTAHGAPAAGVEIDLFRLDRAGREWLAGARTNGDGRTDTPLLKQGDMPAGTYEIVFKIGAYFTALTGQPARFIDEVPIRFRIDDPDAHYHVPLLASPFSYSTYRGS